jgi:hypothetical protein
MIRAMALAFLASLTLLPTPVRAEDPQCFILNPESVPEHGRVLFHPASGFPDITARLSPCDRRPPCTEGVCERRVCRLGISVMGKEYYHVPNIADYDLVEMCTQRYSEALVTSSEVACRGRIESLYVGVSFSPVINRRPGEPRPGPADKISVDWFHRPHKSVYDCFGPEIPQLDGPQNNVWTDGPYRIYVESYER